MSQRIPYCGGEAYLVDEVLNPCGDISAIMGEIANIPSPCRNNVEGVLHRQGLSYFNALLLATGVQRPVFASGAAAALCGVCAAGCAARCGVAADVAPQLLASPRAVSLAPCVADARAALLCSPSRALSA